MKTLGVALCVIGAVLAEQSPVFLWGAQSIAKPSLQTIPVTEFADLISPLLKDHMIVAFQEENLSTNDFVCANDNSPQACYAHLKGIAKKTYYTSVQNPTDALRSLTTDREFITVEKSGELERPLSCAAGKIVFVNFAGPRDLAAHDEAISEIVNDIKCPTVFLYMSAPGTSPVPAKRVRRDTAAENPGYLFRDGSDFLLYFSNLFLRNAGKSEEIIITSMVVGDKNTTSFSVTLNAETGKTLTFMISQVTGGYYSMSNLRYDNMNFYTLDINAPYDFSFFCGNLTLQGEGTDTEKSPYSLLWNSLQLQAPFGTNKGNATFVFGDPWHCVGFFTPGILMGLFLVVLLLFITFTGVAWMMDINTMDRFDDPKGKTITINATE